METAPIRAESPTEIMALDAARLAPIVEQAVERVGELGQTAFEAIDADPNQLLAVAEDDRGVIGTLQLSFIPGLSRKGAWRGQIEAVRVARDCRSEGLGRRMIEWAIAQCRGRDCALVQLTTDKARPDAHRFYEQLGFVASHIGYKLSL